MTLTGALLALGLASLAGARWLLKKVFERRHARAVRWDQQQEPVYRTIRDSLLTILEYTGPKAEEERRVNAGDPQVRSDEQLEAHRGEYDAARRIVHKASLGELLLTPPAVRILKTYERNRDDLDATHAPWQSEHSFATSCDAEFADRSRYDLHQLAWWRYAWRVSRRRVRREWRRASIWWSGVEASVSMRFEEWRLTFGPQLTQSDVRWPPLPKWRHFRSVEQMQRAGLRPGQIQRELRLQHRADPPPWTELPAQGAALSSPRRRPPSGPT